jgi:hypothetical protein
MYEQFSTDKALEQTGVEIDYGDFMVTVARAGGGNERFSKVLAAKSKPMRRLIENELISLERANKLLMEVYAETVILNWETKVDDKWVKGIERSPDDEGEGLLPVTKENIQATFERLPDLFTDIQEQSSKVALFRQDEQEAESGNS